MTRARSRPRPRPTKAGIGPSRTSWCAASRLRRGESPLAQKAAHEVLRAPGLSPAVPGLSMREREVLALVGEGLPNKLIARRLEISEKTVKAHLTRIFQQIGVSDRTQAALWARRHDLS